MKRSSSDARLPVYVPTQEGMIPEWEAYLRQHWKREMDQVMDDMKFLFDQGLRVPSEFSDAYFSDDMRE